MLALTLAVALQTPLNFGQGSPQIDAMGLEGWIAFCEKKMGRDMAEYELRAHTFQYAEAVKAVNKMRFARVGTSEQAHYTALATALETYATKIVAAEEATAGGGTMYILFYASASARAAECARSLVLGRTKGAAPIVVSKVTSALYELDREVKAGDPTFAKVEVGIKSMKEARGAFDTIVKLMSKRPRAESDFVLGFCHSRAEFSSMGV